MVRSLATGLTAWQGSGTDASCSAGCALSAAVLSDDSFCDGCSMLALLPFDSGNSTGLGWIAADSSFCAGSPFFLPFFFFTFCLEALLP